MRNLTRREKIGWTIVWILTWIAASIRGGVLGFLLGMWGTISWIFYCLISPTAKRRKKRVPEWEYAEKYD
ncbi:hypothetical protein DRO54_01955 [Candidatus Bathyarchaeota archaeon]|nr:MAG: hypothetical protein DRO54_01955 [Candidatus Bathyarchaeota archaeon]